MEYPSLLSERTFKFAKETALFCRRLPQLPDNIEYSKQVIRSSSSVGANYIEANDALSRKDFVMRIKICRKEAKESAFFLRLISEVNTPVIAGLARGLMNEAVELKKIFSAIAIKSSAPM